MYGSLKKVVTQLQNGELKESHHEDHKRPHSHQVTLLQGQPQISQPALEPGGQQVEEPHTSGAGGACGDGGGATCGGGVVLLAV